MAGHEILAAHVWRGLLSGSVERVSQGGLGFVSIELHERTALLEQAAAGFIVPVLPGR